MSEHGNQLRVGPTGQIVGFDQPALLDIARARGFDAAVLSELLPAAEFGMLELQAKANRVIPLLQDLGVRIFMGTYASLQKRPRYDMDEGHMYVTDRYVTDRMPKECVTNVRVVVSDEAAGHLIRIPSDHKDLEEIPF